MHIALRIRWDLRFEGVPKTEESDAQERERTRERWDSRRYVERHNTTLQAGTSGVNDSRAGKLCIVMIPWEYIYFRQRSMHGMMPRCSILLPQDRVTPCLIPAFWFERDRRQFTVDSMKLFRRQVRGLQFGKSLLVDGVLNRIVIIR